MTQVSLGVLYPYDANMCLTPRRISFKPEAIAAAAHAIG
jgi:hypothetical protein